MVRELSPRYYSTTLCCKSTKPHVTTHICCTVSYEQVLKAARKQSNVKTGNKEMYFLKPCIYLQAFVTEKLLEESK